MQELTVNFNSDSRKVHICLEIGTWFVADEIRIHSHKTSCKVNVHLDGNYVGVINTDLENAAKVERMCKENGIPVDFTDHE